MDPRGADKLVSMMLSEDPNKRPSAKTVLSHPLFWSSKQILDYLSEISFRIEMVENAKKQPCLNQFVSGGSTVIGNNWMDQLSASIYHEMKKWGEYNGTSVVDLLRIVENTRRRFHEMTLEYQKQLGGDTNCPEFLSYWTDKFPKLIPYTWEIFQDLGIENTKC
jgi:serine/threonine-protein kinase/endoribonuclease IRE1